MASNVSPLDAKSRRLVGQIVEHFKRQGNFDELRRDCLDELDKMESFRQLNQRVESYVATFLSKQEWSDALPKNQVRDSLRKHVNQSDALKTGVERLINQALERKRKSFQMRIEGVVQNYIYTEKQNERQARWKARAGQTDTKPEPEKPETKPSTISDISDIISQIPGMEPSTSKAEPTSSKAHSSSSTTSNQPKAEHSKYEKKVDTTVSTGSDGNKPSGAVTKLSPGIVRSTKGKRIAHRGSTSTSPSVGSPSETKEKAKHSVESGSKAKQHNVKGAASTTAESHPEKAAQPSTSPVNSIELSTTKTKDDQVKIQTTKVKNQNDQIMRSPPTKPKEEETKPLSPGEEATPSFHDVTQPMTPPKTEADNISKQKTAENSSIQDNAFSSKQETVGIEHVGEKELTKVSSHVLAMDRESTLKVETKEEVQEQSEAKAAEDITSTKDTTLDKKEETHPKEVVPDISPEELSTKETKEQSDEESGDESDISDVSSVHTSDLSSFDGEISSDGESESEGGVGPVESQDSDDVIISRPTRSRRKIIESEDTNEEVPSSKPLERPKRVINKPRASADVATKRGPGRPRKDKEQKRSSAEKKQQVRQARSRARHRKEVERNDSSDGNTVHVRPHSKRKIQRKRCYSPSSESTREVCLPSKRTRTGSRD